MKQWQKRAVFLAVSIGIFVLASATALNILRNNMVFFLSPSELTSNPTSVVDREFRLGGVVKPGSVRKIAAGYWRFVVTDYINEVMVEYKGGMPSLFTEGNGVIARGIMSLEHRIFYATELLVKHDENYMPEEVAKSLKESGRWRDKPKEPDYADPNKPPYDVYNGNNKAR